MRNMNVNLHVNRKENGNEEGALLVFQFVVRLWGVSLCPHPPCPLAVKAAPRSHRAVRKKLRHGPWLPEAEQNP